MAVVLIAWAPSREAYEGIHHGLGSAPAAGCIVHTVSEVNDKVRVVEVWESRQHVDEFFQTRLAPVFQKLAVEMDPPELTETFAIERS